MPDTMTRWVGSVTSTAAIAQAAATDIVQPTRPLTNTRPTMTPSTNSRIIGSTKNA
jgi:hypothetical protein